LVKSKVDRIFVYPEFKKKLKMESAGLGISMIDYTKMLSEKEFIEIPNLKKKRGAFDFGF
jgi:hypothetical protein